MSLPIRREQAKSSIRRRGDHALPKPGTLQPQAPSALRAECTKVLRYEHIARLLPRSGGRATANLVHNGSLSEYIRLPVRRGASSSTR
jgi:hypothetical protein